MCICIYVCMYMYKENTILRKTQYLFYSPINLYWYINIKATIATLAILGYREIPNIN